MKDVEQAGCESQHEGLLEPTGMVRNSASLVHFCP